RHLPAGHRLSRQQIASVDVDGIPAHQGVFPKVVPPDVLRLSRRDKEGTPPHKSPSQPKRVNIADSDDAVDGRAPLLKISDLAAGEIDQACLEVFPQVAGAFEDKAAGGHRLLP